MKSLGIWPDTMLYIAGDMYNPQGWYLDANLIKDQHALVIVSDVAERWLLENGWDYTKSFMGGMKWWPPNENGDSMKTLEWPQNRYGLLLRALEYAEQLRKETK